MWQGVHDAVSSGLMSATKVTLGGFTEIFTLMGVPAVPLAVGVMVYVAVPAAPLVAVKVCAMLAPEPAAPPETPDNSTVHVKVVPVTELASEMEVGAPEVMVCSEGVAVATGRTGSSSVHEFRTKKAKMDDNTKNLVFIQKSFKG
jgi:hypothetical protein